MIQTDEVVTSLAQCLIELLGFKEAGVLNLGLELAAMFL